MANVYNRGKLKLVNGTVTWGSSDLRVLLVTSAYTYSADHNFVADLTGELSGGNYARVALGSKTGPTEDDVNDRVVWDAGDTTFTALGAAAGTPTQAIVFLHTGNDATAELIARHTLSPTPAPNGGDYTVAWDSVGLISLGD